MSSRIALRSGPFARPGSGSCLPVPPADVIPMLRVLPGAQNMCSRLCAGCWRRLKLLQWLRRGLAIGAQSGSRLRWCRRRMVALIDNGCFTFARNLAYMVEFLGVTCEGIVAHTSSAPLLHLRCRLTAMPFTRKCRKIYIHAADRRSSLAPHPASDTGPATRQPPSTVERPRFREPSVFHGFPSLTASRSALTCARNPLGGAEPSREPAAGLGLAGEPVPSTADCAVAHSGWNPVAGTRGPMPSGEHGTTRLRAVDRLTSKRPARRKKRLMGC